MQRNVTSLEHAPWGLSKQAQAVTFSLAGLCAPCVWPHLEAWTTATPSKLPPQRNPPVQGSCLIGALPEKLASSGTFYMEHFGSEKKVN